MYLGTSQILGAYLGSTKLTEIYLGVAALLDGPVLDLNFQAGQFDPRIQFSRASTATYFDASGVLREAAVNQPRIDYDPLTLACKGFLVEEARTNFVARPHDISAPPWSGSDGQVITPGATLGPDGAMGASLVDLSATSGTSAVGSRAVMSIGGLTPGATYTFSAYMRSASTNGTFPMAWHDGSVYLKVLMPLTPLWQRFSMSFTAINTTHIIAFSRRGEVQGETLASAYVWGTQLEKGSFATSFIPTYGASVTRARDTASLTMPKPVGANGTLFASAGLAATMTGSVTTRIASVQSSISPDYSNRVMLSTAGSSGYGILKAGGVTRHAETYILTRPNPKAAITWTPTEVVSSFDGSVKTTSVTGASYTNPLDTLHIGDEASGSAPLNAHVSRITYWDKSFPSAKIVDMAV